MSVTSSNFITSQPARSQRSLVIREGAENEVDPTDFSKTKTDHVARVGVPGPDGLIGCNANGLPPSANLRGALSPADHKVAPPSNESEGGADALSVVTLATARPHPRPAVSASAPIATPAPNPMTVTATAITAQIITLLPPPSLSRCR
nr:unnamed protein product [Spirometra erinaceieuropaei]